MVEKENRCWPGYEPVKGKPAHSQGSCRPKAQSKTTPAQKKVRAKRRDQLDKWEAEHPNTRKSASQHLSAPGAKKATKSTAKKAAKPASGKKTAARKSTAKKRTTARASGSRKRTAARSR